MEQNMRACVHPMVEPSLSATVAAEGGNGNKTKAITGLFFAPVVQCHVFHGERKRVLPLHKQTLATRGPNTVRLSVQHTQGRQRDDGC